MNLKSFVFAAFLALFAMPVSAQNNSDWFVSIEENYLDRGDDGMTWISGGFVPNNPIAPLGSGLLVLTAAGAGYAISRRKRLGRKGGALLLAIAMMSVFTQCRKNVDTLNSAANGIPMTLEAYNEAKTSVSETGAISWVAGDKIYVVCDGVCVGFVQNTSEHLTTFKGYITGVTTGTHTLHYYYVGDKEIAGGATSFDMDFSDQTGALADLGKFHIGHGSQEISYTEGDEINAQAGMASLVSIGYFDIAGMAEVGEKVYMYGANVNNKISIDFSNNSVTNTKIDPEHDNNYICLGAVSTGDNGRYVMLVPNNGSETEITFVSKRTSGSCTFAEGMVACNFYCKDEDTGTPLEISPVPYTKGALRGLFTIGENTAVHFSQGNLKAVTTSGWSSFDWYFMDNQYDIVEQANTDIANEYSGKTVVTLLGWGTSGYNHGATNYKPNNTGTSGKDYKAYNNAWNTLYSSNGTADWGYNKIKNSVNEENKWRTLKKAEYVYLFQTRNDAASKWGYATVNDMHGIIIIPDSFDDPYKNGGNDAFDGTTTGWDANVYSLENWNHYMEPAGAVFLPAAGQRSGGVLNQTYGGTQIKPGDYGFYWSSDNNSTSNAEALKFVSNSITVTSIEGRGKGHSVRLVLK